MALEMMGRDLYLRHTDTEGRAHVAQHRVWDAARFIAAQQRAVQKLNTEAQAEKKPAKAHVEQITDEQYRKER